MSLNKPFFSVLCLLILLTWDAAVQASADETSKTPAPAISLVPQPAHLAVTGGAFLLGPKTRIIASAGPDVQGVGALLAHRLRTATGYALPLVTEGATTSPRDAIIMTTARPAPMLGPEGYLLTVTPEHVTIRASAPAGLFYGTQTLRQLLPARIESTEPVNGVAWRVPGVSVSDRPRFSRRGLMLDSVRHYQSIAFIKRTIDRMAYHKLNTFHWHLTDNEGWRIEIKRYPRLAEVGAWRNEGGHRYGGFYTQAQIRGIVSYAAARFVVIIPEIEMPAHSGAAVAAYPFLACTDRPSTVLCPGKPSTYQFVEGVLTEVLALFPSVVIHTGGDECPKDEWNASPECQTLMRQEGLANADALQNHFTRRVAAFLAAHGRRLAGWNEILQGGALPQNVVVQQWNDAQASATAAKAGNDVIVSLQRYAYFDAGNDDTTLSRVYSFEPVPPGLTGEQARHILGVEACLWTETKPTDAVADEYLWPRLIALAEVGWSPARARDWVGFRARLMSAHFERLALMGLGAPGVDIRQGLISRSAFNTGVRIGGWEPVEMSEQWKTLDWDVTPFLHKSGTYLLRLNYEAGADAIAIASVELLRDGQPVAQDIHNGWTGGISYGRVYSLALKGYDAQAHYAMQVRLRSDGGTDSQGAVWLQGPY